MRGRGGRRGEKKMEEGSRIETGERPPAPGKNTVVKVGDREMSENEEREYVLVSLCLLGVPCRFHGKTHRMGHRIGRPTLITKLMARYNLLPLCPELLGGLPTPRAAAHVEDDGRVCTKGGEDVSAQYQKGTDLTVQLCKQFGVKKAYLLKDSPACGKGYGVAALRLESEGVQVVKV